MSLIYVPERKIQAGFKPDFPVELNPNNRFGAGAVVFVPYTGSTGSLDIARNRIAVPVGGITPDTIGQQGRTKKWAGATSEYYARDTVMEFPVGTWAAYVRVTGTLPAYARPLGQTYHNGTSAPYAAWDIEYNANASQTTVAATACISGAHKSTSIANFTNIGTPHLVIATYDGSTLLLYQNNTMLGSISAAGVITYDTTATGNLLIAGSSSITGANRWVGDIYWAGAWPWAFSQEEINRLNADKMQMLRPKQRDLYLAYSSGGAGTITADANITQASNTTSSDASLSISAGASIVQSGNTLTAGATELIQADASLAQAANTLTADASLVSNTITANASITQTDNTLTAAADLLVAADASIAQSGNTLSAASTLSVVADASIAQAANTLASTATTTEIKADASITQAGDTLYSIGQLQSTSQVYGDGGRHSGGRHLSREDVEAAWELLELRRKNALADKPISKPVVKESPKQKPKQEPARPAVVVDPKPLPAISINAPLTMEPVAKLKPLAIGRPMDMAVAAAYSKRISAAKESAERAIAAARQADGDADESVAHQAAQHAAQTELNRIIAMRRRDEEELLMLLLEI